MSNIELIIIGILVFFIVLTYILIIFKFSKKKEKPIKATSYRCIDGDIVKSRGELIIHNLLTKLGLEHIYEKTIHVKGKPIKCDWYLPDSKVYIEYWGLFDKKYLKRKAEKIQLYKKGKLKLVSIEDIDLKNIYKVLPEKLSKYIDSNMLKSGKHCPYCGEELDNRF